MMQGTRAAASAAGPLDPPNGPAAFETDSSRVLEELPQLDLASRRHLADRLAVREDAPKPVLMALALDRIAVAYPILRASPRLADADLVRIVEETSREHHLAIAERAALSPSVTALLVEMSETDVMVRMLRNPGAMFTEYVFRRLVAASRHAAALRDPVIARREMTPETAQDLSRWVCPEQRRRIAERFGPETVLSQADPGASLEPRAVSRPAPSPTAREARVRPHGHPLVEAIRRSDHGKLERTLAEMSGLPRFAVLRILSDPGAESLAVVCRALALKRRLFTALYRLLHEGRAGAGGTVAGSQRGPISYFDRLRLPQAASILQGWRKAPITVWQSKRSWSGRTWLGPDDQAA